MRLIDGKGRRRTVHLKRVDGGWLAWVRVGLVARRSVAATGAMTAVRRLADYMGMLGWREDR